MVGTLFLWIYWPSFNAALASVPVGVEGVPTEALASSQFLSVVNTLLSLLGLVQSLLMDMYEPSPCEVN